MKISLAGSSGTGKSYLARFIADRYDLPICPVGSRSVAAEMGFDSPYDVDKAGVRLEFQLKLFKDKLKWEDDHPKFVTDRTHFDNLSYCAMHDCGDKLPAGMFDSYVNACKRYDRIFYLPLSSFQRIGDDPQRIDSELYHRMFDLLLQGLLINNVTNWTALPEFNTRLDKVTQLLGISAHSK